MQRNGRRILFSCLVSHCGGTGIVRDKEVEL